MRILILLLLLAPPAFAQDVIDLIRADRWAEASAAATKIGDPIAGKIVTYYRMLAPGAARADEIARFMTDNPDWPAQALLARRRDETLAGETDEVARALCPIARPALAGALLRCAEAADPKDAADYARAAWIAGITDAGWEKRFLQRWSGVLTPASDAARFDRLVLSDAEAARRQITRLPLAARPLAITRLAFRTDDTKAEGLMSALPAAQREDPALVLDHARWLRHTGDDAGALALWRKSGAAAQAGSPARLGAFWEERNLMARRLIRAGDAAGAYSIAAGFTEGPSEDVLDATFLAGFIALRLQQDKPTAARHFKTLSDRSASAITQGRAHYWLARAAATPEEAQAEYRRAAVWTTTFYGQLAALTLEPDPAKLAATIAATRDPPPDGPRLQSLAARDLARAAALLSVWGDKRRAQAFLLRLDETSADPSERTLSARLATEFGMLETAVAIARRAGRDGVALIEAGWPVAATVPADAGTEPALALGIMRQESNFDPSVVSRSGARGLMQLMPPTAAQVARRLGVQANVPALTVDTAFNIRLGTAYLAELMDRFNGCTPLAVAAYNAGPGRVREWLGTNGDPRTSEAAMLDWLELIPVAETRNYVQRVIENEVIYRARAGVTAAHPLAPWLR